MISRSRGRGSPAGRRSTIRPGRLDVTDTAAGLTGVPPALPAGTVSVSFTNRAPADKAGFILLVGRVRPGAHYTLAAIRANKIDLTRIADIVGTAAAVPPALTRNSRRDRSLR